MSDELTEKIILDAEDKTSGAFKSVQQNLGTLKGRLDAAAPAFKAIAVAGTVALGAIATGVTLSIKAYQESERAQRQLEAAVIGVSKGTQAQVDQINTLATALQRKSGIDGDALAMGAAQLSTFGLQSKSVVDLTKSLADLTVNQNGVNAGADQYVQSANTIAKALNGQFGVLEKSGIRFTDAQKKTIQFGKESEKVAAIQQGLAQNLRETTDTMGGIDAATAKLSRQFGEIQENIGGALSDSFVDLANKILPVIDSIRGWTEKNPKLTVKILEWSTAIAAIVTALGLAGIAIPKIITGIGLFKTAVGALGSMLKMDLLPLLTNPWVLAFAAAAAAIYLLWNNSESFRNTVMMLWAEIQQNLLPLLSKLWSSFVDLATTIWTGIKPSLENIWEQLVKLKPAFDFIAQVVGDLVYVLFVGLIGIIEGVVIWLEQFCEGLKILLGWLGPPLLQALSWVSDRIMEVVHAFQSVVEWVGKAIDMFAKWVTQSSGYQKGTDLFNSGISGSQLSQALSNSPLNQAISASPLNQSLIPGLGSSSGFGLQQFAAGGIVEGASGSPQIAIVHGGERVLTASEAKNTGQTFNFIFNGDVVGDEGIKQVIQKAIDSLNRKNTLTLSGV